MALWVGLGCDLSGHGPLACPGRTREGAQGKQVGHPASLLSEQALLSFGFDRVPAAMPRESRLEETGWAGISPARQVSAQSSPSSEIIDGV